jgi:hypothetical protein
MLTLFLLLSSRLASRLFETADDRLNSGKRIFMFTSQDFEGNMKDLPPLDPRLNLKLSAGCLCRAPNRCRQNLNTGMHG